MSVGSLILQFFAKHLLQHSSFERRQWTGLWFRYIRMRCPAVDPAATVLALDDEAMFLQIESKHGANMVLRAISPGWL